MMETPRSQQHLLLRAITCRLLADRSLDEAKTIVVSSLGVKQYHKVFHHLGGHWTFLVLENTTMITEYNYKNSSNYGFLSVDSTSWKPIRTCGPDLVVEENPCKFLYAAGLQLHSILCNWSSPLHNNPPDFTLQKSQTTTPRWFGHPIISVWLLWSCSPLFFSGRNYFSSTLHKWHEYPRLHAKTLLLIPFYFWSKLHDTLSRHVSKRNYTFWLELTNEPNCGLMGHDHLKHIPGKILRVGTTPTIYQSFKLGMGFACEVDVYKITITGPQKDGIKVVDSRRYNCMANKKRKP